MTKSQNTMIKTRFTRFIQHPPVLLRCSNEKLGGLSSLCECDDVLASPSMDDGDTENIIKSNRAGKI